MKSDPTLIVQIRALEMQLRAIQARIAAQSDVAEELMPSIRSFADLYGILQVEPCFTEEEIRAAEISWEWEDEEVSNHLHP